MSILSNVRLFTSLLHYRAIFTFIRSLKWFIKEKIIPFTKLNCKSTSFIHPSVLFRVPENIFIGDNCRVQPFACLWASPNAKIVLGDNSGIGPGTMVFSSNHKYKFGELYIKQPWVEKDIIISKNVWIGAGCIITAGVTIGEGSVIGAGSIVNKDIPPFSLAVGIPVKIIKTENPSNLNNV